MLLSNEDAKMAINSNSKSGLRELIKILWSSENSEKELAIMQLSESGPDAILPLLTLLFDLAKNPHPRFPTGKEKEGETAINTFFELLDQFDLQNQDAILLDKLGTLRKQIDDLAINQRLAKDAIFLLGKLKAGEAVPFLIKLFEYRAMIGGYSYTDEMSALESIGSVAIPYLIKAITETENRVRSLSLEAISFEYNINCVKPDSAKKSLFELAEDDHHAESEYEIQRRTYYIQYRALMILRSMKAHQAIPDLKKIIKETKDEDLKSLIKGAITQIRSPYPEGTLVWLGEERHK
jgi:hypothetical protein